MKARDPSTLRSIPKLLASIATLVYLATFLLHLSNGMGIGASIVGGLKDARASITCYTEPGNVWEFIDRDAIQDAWFTSFGHPYAELCP